METASLLDSDSALILSWQTLAAMVTVASAVVVIAVGFLRATWGRELVDATAELSEKIAATQVVIGDRVRAEIRESLAPLERRVERLEDRPSPNPYREVQGE